MKKSHIISLFVACAFIAVIFSTLVTTIAWSVQIEPRAFQCNDSCGWPFDNYWTGMDGHKGAGDTISSGWTWEKLEYLRYVYMSAFLLLWIAGTIIPFKMVLRRIKPPM